MKNLDQNFQLVQTISKWFEKIWTKNEIEVQVNVHPLRVIVLHGKLLVMGTLDMIFFLK